MCASSQFRFDIEGGEHWDAVPTGFDHGRRHCYLSPSVDPFLLSATVIEAQFLNGDIDATGRHYEAEYRRVAALSVGIRLPEDAGPVAIVAGGGKGNAPADAPSPRAKPDKPAREKPIGEALEKRVAPAGKNAEKRRALAATITLDDIAGGHRHQPFDGRRFGRLESVSSRADERHRQEASPDSCSATHPDDTRRPS